MRIDFAGSPGVVVISNAAVGDRPAILDELFAR
jgi:hypothetical protein